MKSMIDTWRKVWAEAPLSSTDPVFPFGIASLAGSTSEGHSNAMPAFVRISKALVVLNPHL